LLLRRAVAIKHAIDLELYIKTLPSIALNRLAETADRVQADPSTAAEEIGALEKRMADVVALHTGTASDRPTNTTGLPSAALQAVLYAWLSSD
jgi:hypothetical protein